MANETLDTSTLVVNLDIPQTIQETILTTTEVVDKDVPQTIQETITGVTNVVEKDIPQTIQETSLSLTAVLGQIGEKVSTGVVITGLTIGKSLNGVFNNFGVIKISVPNSQITI